MRKTNSKDGLHRILPKLRTFKANTDKGCICVIPIILAMGAGVAWEDRIYLKGAMGPISPVTPELLEKIGAPKSWFFELKDALKILRAAYPKMAPEGIPGLLAAKAQLEAELAGETGIRSETLQRAW